MATAEALSALRKAHDEAAAIWTVPDLPGGFSHSVLGFLIRQGLAIVPADYVRRVAGDTDVIGGETAELESAPAMECAHCVIVRHRVAEHVGYTGNGEDFHGSVDVISEGHGLCLRHFAKSRHWPDPGASGG